MGSSYSKKLEKSYLDLTLASKHMARESKKREAESVKSRKNVEIYMKKNEMEVAKIHAENCIRKKSESVKYLRLSARLDAVANKVKSALSQQQLSENMKKVVIGLGGVLESMDVEKISKTMDEFESQFETLDVRTKFMDGAIGNTTASSTPVEDVTSLMNEVGENIGIQVSAELDAEGVPVTAPIGTEEVVNEKVAIGAADSEQVSKSASGANSSNNDSNNKKGGGGSGGDGGGGSGIGIPVTSNGVSGGGKDTSASDLESRFNRLRGS